MYELTKHVEILANNENCVVLKVKPESRIDLICIGCFNGNEDMIRLTKGVTQTITIFYDNKTFSSWYWGGGESKLVSDETKKLGEMVQRCLEDDFDICIHGYDEAIQDTCRIRKLGDTTGEEQTYKLVWFNTRQVVIQKNDCFLRNYDSLEDAKTFVYSMFSSVISEETSKADTGANILTIKGVRR